MTSLSSSCELDRQTVMRSSSCDLDTQIVMRSSSCDSKLWVGQTERQGVRSSTCELDGQFVMRTSFCELDRQIVMCSSSCELDGQFVMRWSSCDSKLWVGRTDRHAIIIVWLEAVSWTCTSSCHHHRVTRICELDMHIVMPSSSCDSKLWVGHTHRHAIIRRCRLTQPSATSPLFFDNLHFEHLSIPNEDFGRRNKRRNPDFEWSTFQGRDYSIWATNNWKVSRKYGFHLLFLLPKSSFGSITFRQKC